MSIVDNARSTVSNPERAEMYIRVSVDTKVNNKSTITNFASVTF